MTVWLRASFGKLVRVQFPFFKAERGGLWIAWPKRASGMASDLSQAEVRQKGLAAGMVDFKVCAIDGTWTGLRFSRRKPAR